MTEKIENKINEDFITNDVLKTILYFDIFNYPLTVDEITNFSHYKSNEVKEKLGKLVEQKILFASKNFISITRSKQVIENRIEGNKNAQKISKKAQKISNFIAQFPFVEQVYISGSLSKGIFGANDDIDYFIVTQPNRLWIARTFLILYKKIFLFNSKKYFCVNYFLTSSALEIPDKNRFTATELLTLLPMAGHHKSQKLLQKNDWTKQYFPNFNSKSLDKKLKKNLWKRILEKSMRARFGDFLENKFMLITKRHQQKKFEKLSKKEFEIAFRGDKNISKHHPNNNQIKIIETLNKKIDLLNKQFGLKIPKENI